MSKERQMTKDALRIAVGRIDLRLSQTDPEPDLRTIGEQLRQIGELVITELNEQEASQ